VKRSGCEQSPTPTGRRARVRARIPELRTLLRVSGFRRVLRFVFNKCYPLASQNQRLRTCGRGPKPSEADLYRGSRQRAAVPSVVWRTVRYVTPGL
jgi:hypothetical protein